MSVQIVVPLFVVAAIIFLVIVYGVMKSPEQEKQERQQKELEQEMRGLCVGTVWTDFQAGSFAMVNISIARDGELITKPGINMRDR